MTVIDSKNIVACSSFQCRILLHGLCDCPSFNLILAVNIYLSFSLTTFKKNLTWPLVGGLECNDISINYKIHFNPGFQTYKCCFDFDTIFLLLQVPHLLWIKTVTCFGLRPNLGHHIARDPTHLLINHRLWCGAHVPPLLVLWEVPHLVIVLTSRLHLFGDLTAMVSRFVVIPI